MSTSEPLDLRLPTPSCFADPERAGLEADAVFAGMTEHLFFTLGKPPPPPAAMTSTWPSAMRCVTG